MQRMGHDVHLCLVPFNEFTVEPDVFGGLLLSHKSLLPFIKPGWNMLLCVLGALRLPQPESRRSVWPIGYAAIG